MIEIGHDPRTQTLTLKEALGQGFGILADNRLTLNVPFNATGVTHYVVGEKMCM